MATKNRAAELANRALKSVAAQTCPPDFLVVVDDSDQRHRDDNQRVVAAVDVPRARVMYLENDRTRGASGAWNVGIDRLQRMSDDASKVFVAILDDDDSWEPEYLESCLSAVVDQNLDMVAADIVRHELVGEAGAIVEAPASLDCRVFLASNPGIQGSNLFVRLGTLLAAGLFDEALPSTTDRDLCIRIADLGDVRYARLPRALVHHHAEPGRSRLSTVGSAAKLEGLTGFWQKYRARMTDTERGSFLRRASEKFGWSEPDVQPRTLTHLRREANGDAHIVLLVGVIVSSMRARDVENLLTSLVALRSDRRLVGIEVVLLENGPRGASGSAHIEEIAAWLRAESVGCFVLTLEQQAVDASEGRFGAAFERKADRASIAVARTMLQAYLYELGRTRPGAVVWILDEDMILETLTWRAGRGVAREPLSLVDSLAALSEAEVDVAIGTVTDAPPVPFASCVRTQLVDAYHNLEVLAVLEPDVPVPDRMPENMAHRARCEDYYYDLSRRETDHLESPFWYATTTDASARVVFSEMVTRLPRILAGEQVFRPLILEAGLDPIALAKPSIHRGGNAFIFDIEALRDFSNAVPEIGGHSTRRSDMVWSLLNRYVAGRRVLKVPIAVRQDRGGEPAGALDLDKLCRDIHGFAVYSALESLFLDMLQSRRGTSGATKVDLAMMGDEGVQFAIRKFRKFLRERTAAFVLSFHRAAGLARALGRYVAAENGASYWWLRDASCGAAVAVLRDFVDVLKREYAVERLRAFQARVHDVSDEIVADYIAALRQDAAARGRGAVASTSSWIEPQRIENARVVLEREHGASSLRHLGSGSEGVAFTDGVTVFKCIDYWKTRQPDAHLAFLRSQVGAWSNFSSLYPLADVRTSDSRVVISYPYEPSEPYAGGHGHGLLELLRDFRAAGIVSTNMHPSNLVVVDGRVKLIDYGADIRRYSDEGFRKMARRAFLAFRHAKHPQLKALMRRSIDSETMPELRGFEHFWSAIDPASKERLVDERVVELVSAASPSRVLDYGCGRGRIAMSVSRSGAEVVAYDPDTTLREEWARLQGGGVRFLGVGDLPELRAGAAPFDVIVCCLVICTLRDREARAVLDDVRALLGQEGVALVVVCNPGCVATQTALQQRILPDGWSENEVFEYKKVVRSSGRSRIEVHRPFASYEKLLADAGLELFAKEGTTGVNVEDFELASEFLLLQCRRAEKRRS